MRNGLLNEQMVNKHSEPFRYRGIYRHPTLPGRKENHHSGRKHHFGRITPLVLSLPLCSEYELVV